VGLDSTTYAATDAGTVTAVSTQGETRWHVLLGAGLPLRSAPALGADGTLYVGGDQGALFALDAATGAVKWTYPTGGAITAAPAVGEDGLVYLASTDGWLYVLGREGGLRTKFQVDAPIDTGSPAIGADGTLYVGTRSGALYALVNGASAAQTPGPLAQQYPYVRCPSGKVYALNPDGSVGAYVSDPAVIGTSPVLQATTPQTAALVSALCGPAR
jgi:outer membrane protein assembly factor BamB